ncbi:hypothetical protein HK104_002201 [Borealophlyctis nickersoniae]|nr:hypothetical protein HK104_002201 [Borealophlyctis nickersoniae]
MPNLNDPRIPPLLLGLTTGIALSAIIQYIYQTYQTQKTVTEMSSSGAPSSSTGAGPLPVTETGFLAPTDQNFDLCAALLNQIRETEDHATREALWVKGKELGLCDSSF